MTLLRVLQSAPATQTHTFKVDEQPTDASGTVTATLKRLDGTQVDQQNATHTSTGVYQYTMPAQANLDTLTLDWTGTFSGSPVTVRDVIEVCGGFLFNLSDARAMKPVLDAATWPAQVLATKRTAVEQECETICRQAFVPRFTRVALSGRGNSYLGLPARLQPIRAVRAVSVAGAAWSTPDVEAVGISGSMLVRAGGAVWPTGAGNIIVEYEYGLDYPPADISEMAAVRLRSKLNPFDTGVPANALSFTATDGGTYRLSTPSEERTGIPDVDGVYIRYRRRSRAVIA